MENDQRHQWHPGLCALLGVIGIGALALADFEATGYGEHSPYNMPLGVTEWITFNADGNGSGAKDSGRFGNHCIGKSLRIARADGKTSASADMNARSMTNAAAMHSEPATTGTVAMWIKVGAYNAGGVNWLIFNRLGTLNPCFVLRCRDSGSANYRLEFADYNGAWAYGLSDTNLRTNEWFFAGWTFDSGAVTFYLNGEADGTYSSGVSTMASGAQWQYSWSGTSGVRGWMDGIVVFNRVLSPNEMRALYQRGGL